jgi:hypothetical protein
MKTECTKFSNPNITQPRERREVGCPGRLIRSTGREGTPTLPAGGQLRRRMNVKRREFNSFAPRSVYHRSMLTTGLLQ